MNNMLHAENISKSFNETTDLSVQVLKNVSFSLEKSETAAIIGTSGSGKTTLLNILGGLDAPSEGKVFLNQQNLHLLTEKQRCLVRNKHFGFIYQFHHLLPEFTALENVAMPKLISGTKIQKAKQEAEAILKAVGLEHRLNHKPSELSGGERQRAAIARALVYKPDCIFADEPTGNLDRKNAEQAIDLITQLNQQFATSLVIVTHDLEIAKRMDTIYRLEDGVLTQ